MKKKLAILSLIILFTACSKSTKMKDGVYEGSASSEGDTKSTVKVQITIKDEKITDVIAKEFDKNNKEKGDDYGKEAGDNNYKLAQKAVKGFKNYPKKLIESQNIDEVDSISGSTVSYKLFKESVKNALDKAK